jgi:hypothetical protein
MDVMHMPSALAMEQSRVLWSSEAEAMFWLAGRWIHSLMLVSDGAFALVRSLQSQSQERHSTSSSS